LVQFPSCSEFIKCSACIEIDTCIWCGSEDGVCGPYGTSCDKFELFADSCESNPESQRTLSAGVIAAIVIGVIMPIFGVILAAIFARQIKTCLKGPETASAGGSGISGGAPPRI
jgi:hypothetical protein